MWLRSKVVVLSLIGSRLTIVRGSIRPEAGVPVPHPLLARTVALLLGSQFPRQTALGGRHGISGGRRQGLTGEG